MYIESMFCTGSSNKKEVENVCTIMKEPLKMQNRCNHTYKMENKTKTVYLALILLFFLNIGCGPNIDRNKKESIAIVTLLYNRESSKLPPPPPPPKGIPANEIVPFEPDIQQEYLSDQKIYKKKVCYFLKLHKRRN